MPNKVIAISIPYLYGIDECIEKNLVKLGFEVLNFSYNERDFHYPTIFSRLKAHYYKRVKRNQSAYRNYKKYIQYLNYEKSFDEKLKSLGSRKIDYTLCIRADAYPKEMIQKLKSHSHKIINYQWDGLSSFPDIIEYVDFFDEFFVFDEKDLVVNSKFKQATNFYFDYLNVDEQSKSNKFYYVGMYEKERYSEVEKFAETILRMGYELDFNLVLNTKKKFYLQDYFNVISGMGFEENLCRVRNCQVVVDFLNKRHNGLSFRAFEALCFNKKLITNNESVKNYPFYHPNNIFVWNSENSDELSNFLSLPYQIISDDIKKYYAFSQWIQRILD